MKRWLIVVGSLIAATLVEYGLLGVLAVAVAMHGARIEKPLEKGAWLLLALLLISAKQFNAAAVLAIPVAGLLLLSRIEVPRIRGAFYWSYASQWPLIAGVAWLLSK